MMIKTGPSEKQSCTDSMEFLKICGEQMLLQASSKSGFRRKIFLTSIMLPAKIRRDTVRSKN
jgi:hypothetical protein